MRDAGRVGQLPPCRPAPRSCRPSSGCRNPSAVLQCLRVRSCSASVTSSRSARLSSHSILRLTVPLRRWRRAAARLSRLLSPPDAALVRRLAGQHTTFLVRCPAAPEHSVCRPPTGRPANPSPRDAPTSFSSPCRTVLAGSLSVWNSPSLPSRPRLFPPGLTPRTSDRSPWYPPHPPVLLAPAGWRPLLRPEALHRSGAPRRTRLGRWTGCQGSAGRVGH